MKDLTKVFISLKGTLSKEALEKINGYNTSNSTWFFVGYSESEVFKGAKFSKVFDNEKNFICEVDAEIINITQEFNVQWESIPKGWKTICEIKFEHNFLKIKEYLEETNNWFASGKSILLVE